MSTNTFKLEVAGLTKELSLTIEESDLKFIAEFRRPEDYEGEFGFDWMRDDYSTDCEDYESLKTEYTPAEIHGEEYLVPWLSMFPKQEEVKLKLSITEIEGLVLDSDVIKFPAKDGITFDPAEVKVSEAEGKEISITCDAGIGANVVLDLLDKNDEIVGKLNFFKNNEIPKLPIRIIKILDNGEDQKLNNFIFGDVSDETVNEVKEMVVKKGLNQALIQAEFEAASYADMKELKVDLKKAGEDGMLTYFSETSTQPHFLGGQQDEFRDFLVLKQNEEFGEFKGIIVFTTVVHSKSIEAGFSWVLPRKNQVVMIPDGGFGASTYLHEMGHALGLVHTFGAKDEHHEGIEAREKNIGIYEDNIEIYENNIKNRKAFLAKYKSRKSSDVLNFKDGTKKTVKKVREEGQASIKEQEQKIKEAEAKIEKYKKENKDRSAVSNKYYFEQATTDNSMDYAQDKSMTVFNPHKAKHFFHKYQWPLMQEGVKIIT